MLTSILKNMKVSTYEAIMSAGNDGDNFDFTPYIGTLENDGVGLAPFHNFEDKVPPTVVRRAGQHQGRHHRRLDPSRRRTCRLHSPRSDPVGGGRDRPGLPRALAAGIRPRCPGQRSGRGRH